MSTITIQTLAKAPKPILLIQGDTAQITNIKSWCDISWLVRHIDPEQTIGLFGSAFRGVSIDRLPQVLNTGIDVVPATAPIFADSLDKAFEYGGVPKIVLALDPAKLDRTFREVPADTPADETAEIKKIFPTEIASVCGGALWFTRLSPNDRRAATPYESDYARWIPGNSMDALRAIIICADSLEPICQALSGFASQS